MTDAQMFYIMIIMFLVTFVTRALPFYLIEIFKSHPIVIHLGNMLPPCVMLTLVVYSLKDVDYLTYPYGLVELASVTLVALVHFMTRNIFYSLTIGIVSYYFLIKWLI